MSGRPLGKRLRLIVRWAAICLAATVLLYFPLVHLTKPDTRRIAAANADVDGLTSVLHREVESNSVPLSFVDVSEGSGIVFHHFPRSRTSQLPEDMGSGIACGDFDSDGLPDLFFVNFALPVGSSAVADPDGRCRLFRNLGNMRFEDVTEVSSIDLAIQGMGAAWGDYDNDGDLDLYVTADGGNTLLRNKSDGTFEDVTDLARVQDSRFSAGCSWGDYDHDGNLDLYVCNYVEYIYDPSTAGRVERQYDTEQPFTLNPSSYAAQPNALFRNRGDGTFEEVRMATGTSNPESRSLSASWADLDNDGWIDLYVANDVSKNDVYRNRGDGTFEDIGPSSLAADYRGAMGIAVGDVDNDGDHDLFVSHWLAQENALYSNMLISRAGTNRMVQKKLWFIDAADQVGLGQVSLDMIGWASGFCDFDNDGLQDLWLVNGSTLEDPEDHSKLVPQPAFLFWNLGESGFVNIASAAAPTVAKPFVGRGGVHADLDRDGRMDLVLGVHGGAPMILRNETADAGHWIQVRLAQSDRNTRALGARVYVSTESGVQMAEMGSSSSYLSQDETLLHFGLGTSTTVSELRIIWPDGTNEIHAHLEVDREHVFTRTE